MFYFVISLTILIPLIIGLIRFRDLKPEYLPFFWTLVAGLITEIVSFILINRFHYSNAIPTNLYVLAEWTLLVYQFRIWGTLKKNNNGYFWMLIVPTLIWFVENLVFGKIMAFSPYFRMLYAFLLVLLSITEINYKITHENKQLYRSPKFILCIGLILFFVYQILYEWAYQLSLIEEPTRISGIISSLFAYIDAIANIIFGIAFWVIPAQKNYRFNIEK
ncbi:MAG: hypothetical protein ACHQET_05735 [Chitinophagales bacterium]